MTASLTLIRLLANFITTNIVNDIINDILLPQIVNIGFQIACRGAGGQLSNASKSYDSFVMTSLCADVVHLLTCLYLVRGTKGLRIALLPRIANAVQVQSLAVSH